MIVDVHAHLDHPLLKERLDEIIKNAREADVKRIISAGVDPQSNREVLEFSKKYDIVNASLGIYPPWALKREVEGGEYETPFKEFDIDEEIAFIRENKDRIVAIGEVGLDYNYKEITEEEKEKQRGLFKKMIALAKELKLPLVVHSRKAEKEVIEILEEEKAENVVMHCFCGKFKLVKRIVGNGWNLSLPTNIVRNELFQKVAREIELSKILTETDAPYLSPFKETVNEPAFVTESIKKIAEIKGMDPKEVANIIYMNYQRIFE